MLSERKGSKCVEDVGQEVKPEVDLDVETSQVMNSEVLTAWNGRVDWRKVV